MSRELDKFGKFIMKNLRDRAIDNFDKLSMGYWKASSLQPLQSELHQFNEEQLSIIRRSIISVVDSGLHDFLFAIQEASDLKQGIKIMVDETDIAQISDGLHGDLFGWFAKFSKYGEPPERD